LYERIDQYLERDLTIVEKRDLPVQSKVMRPCRWLSYHRSRMGA
jgi:hypothetical protein